MKPVLVSLILLSLIFLAQSSLSPSSEHVCTRYNSYYTTVSESYQTSTGWWTGKHKVTRYRTKQEYRSKPVYYCCDGWTQLRTSDSGCSLPICYGRTNSNGACNYRGHCVSPNTCVCNTGYTGNQCDNCLDETGDPEHSIYWHINSHPDCRLTCSWKNHWCWPGDCLHDRLRTSCTCRDGFRKIDGGTSYTKCDLTEHVRPELLTCNMEMTDATGRTRRTTAGSVTGCASESDNYVDVLPKSVLFNFMSQVKSPNLTAEPYYIQQQGIGIVAGQTVILKQSISGHATTIRTDYLHGGTGCSKTLGDTSPSAVLSCSNTFPVSTIMQDGERLCIHFSVTAGGYFKYSDFDGHPKGTQIFSHQMSDKQLCFRYDLSKPVHCSKLSGSNSCSTPPMELSTRVTRTVTTRMQTSGWTDPVPTGGKSDTSSGLSYTKIQIMNMTTNGFKLVVVNPAVKELIFNGSFNLDEQITFPDKSGLYAVLLEIWDKAKNIQTVRRLVLYDKNSKIRFDSNIPLQITTASASNNHVWQTNLGPVCANWKGRYYNDQFKANNPLLPVMSQPEVATSYDQTSGQLPITGTTNVDGITEAQYSFSIDTGTRSAWRSVPHFTNQSLCLTPKLLDGQTYTFSLKMTDIMKNSFTESVTIHIDSTVPDISHMWLVKDGNTQVYVHDSLDLSTMVLQFDVTDPHSGVKFVQWYLGTRDHSPDLGHGVLPVQKLNGTTCPLTSSCYCPSVGECQYSNYTVKLNSLVNNKTNFGQHNQAFYFTVMATNEVGLKNIDHLDILVDTSPPETGSVKEGSADGPDVDYTSEDNVLVSWAGFIDHESGINHYLVAVAPTCLSLAQMENSSLSQSIVVSSDLSEESFSISNGRKYYASVVAYNEALSPSKVICSDGITKDDSPPVIYNVSVSNAKTSDHVVCHNGFVWLLSGNLTMVRLEKSADCQKICRTKESPMANILPKSSSQINDTDISDHLCRVLPYLDASSIIYLPSDKIYLSWNSSETESQLRDFSVGFGSDISSQMDPDLLDYKSTKGHSFFKLNHAGFAGKNVFFFFLKAVNKAGLTTHASIGPVMIDYTPPVVKETLKPVADGDFVFVRWNKTTFDDPEQQDTSYMVLYRIVHNGKHVTPILQTPKASSKSCQAQGYAGCIRYPLKRLQQMDSALNIPFIFELYVYNSAGHFSVSSTKEIQVTAVFSPGHGIVHDIDPSHLNDLEDVDFHITKNKACVQWSGFYHHVGVSFEIAIGTSPNTSDVITYQTATSHNQSCISSSSLKPRTKYYATVKATCSGGTAYASSNGFVIIDQPKDDQFVLKIYDGVGCNNLRNANVITLRPISSSSDATSPYDSYTTTDQLHVGQRYTMQFSATSFTAASNDVLSISSKGIKQSFQFIPLVYYPTFNITNSNTSSSMATPTIQMCSEDDDYRISGNTISFHWVYLGPWKSFTTHLEVELVEETKCSNGSTCFITVGSRQTKRLSTYIDFTNVNLYPGKTYLGKIRPCFDRVCLDWISSDGVSVVSEKVSLKISNEWQNIPGIGCDSLTINVDYIDCGEKPTDSNNIIYQWYVADRHGSPLQPWKTDQELLRGKATVCLNSTFSSSDDIQLCMRVTCPSGLTSSICDAIPKRNTLISDARLIETSMRRIKDIDIDIQATEHILDIDYAESSIKVAGVLKTLEGRNSTWYIMKERRIPSQDCDLDNACIATKESTGPIGTFPGVTLNNNGHYFICVHSPTWHSSGGSVFPAVTLCGDGFITDNDPPTKGEVQVLNHKDGFLTELNNLVVTWKGFTDHETKIADNTVSGIASFSYAVGTSPESQDLLPFTNVGFVHNTHVAGIKLQCGETYYVSVKATDHLGHITIAVSESVTVDVTPPVQGNVFIGSAVESHMAVSSDNLLVHWEGFHDQESGIESFQLAVASKETSEVIPFTEYPGSFATLRTKGRLVDGHKYIVKLQATNRAGLSSVGISSPFTFDRSPPVVGVVRDGENMKQTEDDYQISSDSLTCHWTGFHDPHSGLSYFRVGLGTQPDMDDVVTMTHVGLRSEMSWTGDLLLGSKLYCSVEVCNQAGLCSKSASDGITLDNSPPVAGVVFVGSDGHHHKYYGHVSTLTVSWYGFEDPQTGINHFDWCVGSTPGHCDIVVSTNNLLSDSVIKTGLSLTVGKPLYVTVNATNPAGLVSSSTSESFIVDNSPPTLVEKPTFTPPYKTNEHVATTQWENSILQLAWKFQDAESPIERHLVSLSTHHDSTAAVENVHLGAQETATILFEKDNLMRSGDIYTAIVTACNAAGLCSSASSSDILIDSTSPEIGGIKYPLTWETIDRGGRSTTRLHIRWYGFSDAESGISSYRVAVSRLFDDSELTGGTLTINHNSTYDDQIAVLDLNDHVHTGENIVITLTAHNHAGLPSKVGKVTVAVVASDITHSRGKLDIQRHSCSVQYCTGDCTCAVVGQKCLVTDAQRNCTDITSSLNQTVMSEINVFPGLSSEETVTKSASCLSGHWRVRDPSILHQIKRFEWSMGQKGEKIGVGVFDLKKESIWYSVGKRTQVTHCLQNGTSLQHGAQYVVYVRVWFGISQYSIFQSHSILVDHTPPSVGRAKSPLDSDETCQDDMDFFAVGKTIKVCWDKVFDETQSSLKMYEFWLGTLPEGNDVQGVLSLGNQTSYKIPPALLKTGIHYYATIRATNMAGLQTTSVSDGFVIDDVPPVAGVVFNTARHRNIRVQSSNNTLKTSWHGFEDYHSYVKRFEVAVLEDGQSFQDSMFKYFGIENELVLNGLNLNSGKDYRVAVRALDAAGLVSDVVFSPTISIDATAPSAVECTSYLALKELKFNSKFLKSPGMSKAEINTTYTMKKGTLYELTVVGEMSMYETHVTFTVGKLSVIGKFVKKQDKIEASHMFLYEEDGLAEITIQITGPNVSDVSKVCIQQCQSMSTANHKKAIRVRQIRPSVVAVCTNIRDPESDIKSIWMGAGTSKGGYQIRALSPTAVSNHEMILVQEPHGSPVYVTVMAENRAGLRSFFTSSSIIIDHTPPEVTFSKVFLNYDQTSTDTVTLDVSWQIKDDESNVDVCFCAAGNHVFSFTDASWQEAREKGHCIISNMTAHHNSLLYASIRCINSVSLETTISSEPLRVLHHAPALPPDSLQILIDNQVSTGTLTAHVQSYSDHVECFWHGIRIQGLSYEVRLVEGGVPVSNWISTGTRTYAKLDGLSLLDGHVYEAQVRAMNERKQYSQSLNTSVVVESRSPITTGKRPVVHLDNGHLSVDWNHVFDVISMDATYTISIGTRQGYADIINQMVTKDTQLTSNTEQISTGVFVTIMARIETGKFGLFAEFLPLSTR